MNKLRVGVIGVGNMGKFHVINYSELNNVELIAISDVNEEKGRKMAEDFNCKFYRDFKEMIRSENLDIVSVCVPTKYHKDVVIFCLNNKVNVLVEKPIADTLINAEEMIEASNKNNVKLTVGHIERFNPAVIKLKEVIQEGRLGKISSIIIRRVGVCPPQIKDANVIIDLGVHDIDIINYLLERNPDKIEVNGGKSILDNRYDYADIFMRYGNTSVLIQVNWITPVKIRKINITGSKGYAELDYITQELTVFESNYSKSIDNFGDFIIKFGKPNKIEIGVDKEQPLRRELNSFVQAVIENKEPEVTPTQALNALRIALDINKKVGEKQ